MFKKAFFIITFSAISFLLHLENLKAQEKEEKDLKLSGELRVDERFLLKNQNDWAWNETRLSLNLDRTLGGKSKFHSEMWFRSLGLPAVSHSADLYNKGIIDPFNLEIREAWVQLNGFLSKNLDLTIGRQRIPWGTADELNPTDNLNPYDMEDILDFGRYRGSDAINFQYYFNYNYSVQAVFIPFFRPANLPLGIFAGALNPEMKLPQGMILREQSDTVLMPRYNLRKSSSTGLRFKGFERGVDFSLSYVWGLDGLPVNSLNTFLPLDTLGGIGIYSQLLFARNHILGADLATSIGGAGFWAEAALFIPHKDIVQTNDLSALFPMSPAPVLQDSLILEKSVPYLKFIVGGDYFFSDGSYFNLQYMHGFIHERGREGLNDYLFLHYEKNFLNDRLKIAPLSGAFIIADWENVKENYAIAYMPEISFNATPNSEITISTAIFNGKGDNFFANMKDYNMFILMMRYSF